MREKEEVIQDIKKLVQSQGYIYALCMILFEDFHLNLENAHKVNSRERISVKEASLLLGFLIQRKLDFTHPESYKDLFEMKQKTYELLQELQASLSSPFIKKMKEDLQKKQPPDQNFRDAKKDFFGSGEMLIEPMFYAGTQVYDFQYLEFMQKKYKYDRNWLLENTNFDLDTTENIIRETKKILGEKSQKVYFFELKEKKQGMIQKMQEDHPGEDWETEIENTMPYIELYQYRELFLEKIESDKHIEAIREESWRNFYEGLVDLFTVQSSDYEVDKKDWDSFISSFSTTPGDTTNSHFNNIGDYNVIESHPMIKIDSEKYFIPVPFLLFQSAYESPFYWMWKDKDYQDKASTNRGQAGEDITYDFLCKVFGKQNVFKSVLINPKKGQTTTDIDILCILENKALCVQVKSKKLTEFARKGDDEVLKNDFKKAVQDAYEQGLTSRREVLNGSAKFTDKSGNELHFSNQIEEVYIMGITTENYPSLTHQADILLDKKEEDPYPLFLSVFDLELLSHYLKDPYEFLYYVRQRITLTEHIKADEEIVYLGYHLDQKLCLPENTDFYMIDNDFGQLIDRNYYPYKANIEVSDEGDVLKKRWHNADFDQLCNELKNSPSKETLDIIFYLYDLNGSTRENLVHYIKKTKEKTEIDKKDHDFSVPPDESNSLRLGITYKSVSSNDLNELQKKLTIHCQARKYRSKGDVWLGLGSIKDSTNMVDLVVLDNEEWKHNPKKEAAANQFLGKGGTYVRLGNKIGRNEECVCGSRLKYKKCCGRKRT